MKGRRKADLGYQGKGCNAKADELWAQVQKILEEEDTDWNPYPDGEEGMGED